MSRVVRVRFFATLRLALGVAFIDIELREPVRLIELIRKASDLLGINLEEKLLEGKGLKRGTMLLINGRNAVHLSGLDTLVEGGEVSIFPPAGGG